MWAGMTEQQHSILMVVLRAIQNFTATASLTAGQVVRLDSANASFIVVAIYDVGRQFAPQYTPVSGETNASNSVALNKVCRGLGQGEKVFMP